MVRDDWTGFYSYLHTFSVRIDLSEWHETGFSSEPVKEMPKCFLHPCLWLLLSITRSNRLNTFPCSM